jgi:putative transposase
MTLYADGLEKVKFKSSELKEVIEDILSLTTKNKLQNNQLFMQEYLQKNNKLNSKIKSNICKKSSQNILLSQILDLDLIQIEKDSNKFWTNFSRQISKKLWLPLKTDLCDLTLNFSNKSFKDLVPNLKLYQQKNINPHMKNFQKILCQSLQSSRQDNIVKDPILKTRKIRIYPTKKQKLYYNKCFGTTRYIYNQIVEFVTKNNHKIYEQLKKQSENGCVHKSNDQYCKHDIDKSFFCKKHKNTKIDYGFNLSLGSLRKHSKLFTQEYINENKWLEDVPYDTRQLVINDFIGAYKAVITNFKNGNIKNFDMGFKSRKMNTQFFHIDKRAIKKNITIFKRKKLGKTRIRKRMKKWYKKNINDKITNNCKIICYRPGIYYLLLTVKDTKKDVKSNFKCVSLDPGVRTFQTFYSPDGIGGKIGDEFISDKLTKIASRIDKLDSVLTSKIKGKTKRNIKNRQFLLRTKIKNSIIDLHWKTAHFLCKNFETIIIPKFECKNMSNKKNRINSKITRKMLTLSHGMFLEKLKFKCNEYNRNLILTNESYTSKTCTNCGNIKNDLNGNKKYNCSKCNISIDRDINGARNILIKAFSRY